MKSTGSGHLKDSILNELAKRVNVAQFVSFDSDLTQRFAWIRGHDPNRAFDQPLTAIAMLLKTSDGAQVNVRSFDPRDPKSKDFVYGLISADEALVTVKRLAAKGLHTIVNETIDIHDGGVSGVAFGNLVEFAPEDWSVTRPTDC